MSIFGKIMSAIFGTKADARRPAAARPAGAGSSGGPPLHRRATVDVAPILDKAVKAKGEKAGVAHLDRRPDEGARHRFQLLARARSSRRSSATPATATIPPA
jgi:hypothetical protein